MILIGGIILNCLIVMPRIVEKKGDWYFFPLGIAYVSSSMKKAGLDVINLNLNDTDKNVEEVMFEYVNKFNIDIVLTGGLTGQYNSIREIICSSKKCKKKIINIVGGGIITSAPEIAMEALEFADFGIIGEGEITAVELCQAIMSGGDFNIVDGLVFYDEENRYLKTKKREEIENLDLIDMPDYEGFNFENIVDLEANLLSINKKKTGVIIASRSCPFQCTFCFHSSGSKYRQRSLDNIFKEIDYLVSKYSIEFLFIADELFSYDFERVEKFCTRIKTYNIKWWTEFRVNDVSVEMIEMLKNANCISVCYGLESADNKILKSMRKNITIEDIEKALKITYEAGIIITGAFIFGDINETVETYKNTINWWQKNRHYGISLNLILVYPGTYLYKYALKNKIITDEVKFIKDGCPLVNVSKLTNEEYNKLADEITFLMHDESEPLMSREIEINNSGRVSFVGECSNCHTTNKWENIAIFTVLRVNCKKCGCYHKIPAFEEVKTLIVKEIEFYLNQEKTIAFWGMSRYFKIIFENVNLTDEKIVFIDASPLKRKLGNKKVFGPEILNEKNIDIIIIAVPKLYEEIKNYILKEYNFDKKISNILDIYIN